MSKPKGGRGKIAPYKTTHMRVPVPLKKRVSKLIEEYRDGLSQTDDEHQYSSSESKELDKLSLTEAKEKCKDIVKQKKSARVSLAKLLTALYGEEVAPQDLDL